MERIIKEVLIELDAEITHIEEMEDLNYEGKKQYLIGLVYKKYDKKLKREVVAETGFTSLIKAEVGKAKVKLKERANFQSMMKFPNGNEIPKFDYTYSIVEITQKDKK